MQKASGKARALKRARTGKNKRAARFDWWKLPWLLLLVLGALWPRICAGHAGWIERVYSMRVYPVVKDALSVLTSLVPFSVAELIFYALILGVLVVLLGNLAVWAFGRITGKRLVSVLLSVCLLAGAIWNLFYLTWGFNYFRTPLKDRMGLTVIQRPVGELETLARSLCTQAGALRETLEIEPSGLFSLSQDMQDVLDALPEAYEALAEEQPVFDGRTARAKRVLWSEGLSWSGIAGVYIGLTAEPNINAAQPDLLIPQAAAHEMAHQLGIASEDEAEFAAYLACLHADDARVRYSGLMGALMHCANALKKADPVRYDALAAAYSEGMRRDLLDYEQYWARYDGPVEQAADRANDRYLKHNAQESGVKSYGESVDLLLAYHDLIKN